MVMDEIIDDVLLNSLHGKSASSEKKTHPNVMMRTSTKECNSSQMIHKEHCSSPTLEKGGAVSFRVGCCTKFFCPFPQARCLWCAQNSCLHARLPLGWMWNGQLLDLLRPRKVLHKLITMMHWSASSPRTFNCKSAPLRWDSLLTRSASSCASHVPSLLLLTN